MTVLSSNRSERLITRTKISAALFATIFAIQYATIAIADNYYYQGELFEKMQVKYFARGRITEFTSLEEFCDCSILPPGFTLLSRGALGVIYFIILVWLFLGINTISDIFMDGIEVITSSKREVTQVDPYSGENKKIFVPVWNPTVANLTLMALGSSAPEIFISVIETVNTLGGKPGELGPSTIVGSAAFNFLVISAVSIISVDEDTDSRTPKEMQEDGTDKGVKKINDIVVFIITTTFSVVAYLWLFYVLNDETIKMWEAWVTLAMFIVLLVTAYIADCCRAKKIKEVEAARFGNMEHMSVIDFYEKLIPLEKGQEPTNEEEKKQAQDMKEFLRKNFNTTSIAEINKQELKNLLEGDHLVERIGYRKKVALNGARDAIEKGAIIRTQNKSAHDLKEKDRNQYFGFSCLHYSVSEGCEVIRIKVLNKTAQKTSVHVRTRGDTATEGEDFEKLDQVLEFKQGMREQEICIKIYDDDEWEPDEDFFVDLFDPKSKEKLIGGDTTTRVTIIDDDKPGDLVFAEKRSMKHPANENICRVEVKRINGSDGKISCSYRTVELDQSDKTAIPDVDYTPTSGELVFEHGEVTKTIEIKILDKREEKGGEEVKRDEILAIKLENPLPDIVKISKKDTLMVEIVTDAEAKRQNDALTQLLNKIQQEEKITYGQQFINACLLHPRKNEEGEIEQVTCMEALLHFLTIGWKFAFAIVPPPHIWGGWACFIVAIICIGMVTFVVGEIAAALGCVFGIKPGVTAITFVAIGTSLPDTFASQTAARDSRYADSAVGNVTGSNSVNVFLGLGFPWVIACLYYKQTAGTDYNVPTKGLTLSVIMFLGCSLIGIAILIIRRICVKGELGGSPGGRWVSGIILIGLWLTYIIVVTLAQYEIIPDLS